MTYQGKLYASYRDDPLLTMAEVAQMFRVHPKTCSRWAADGILPAVRTPSGQYRVRNSVIEALRAPEPRGEAS